MISAMWPIVFPEGDGQKGLERYQGAQWRELSTGTLALVDALTVLDCELDDAVERHSHGILIGRVRAVTLRRNAEPLLYWHGAYRHIRTATEK